MLFQGGVSTTCTDNPDAIFLHNSKEIGRGRKSCCRTDGCNWNDTTAQAGTSLSKLLEDIAKANATTSSTTSTEEAFVAWIPLVIIAVIVFIFLIFCLVCICYKYVKTSPTAVYPDEENTATKVKEAVAFFARVL